MQLMHFLVFNKFAIKLNFCSNKAAKTIYANINRYSYLLHFEINKLCMLASELTFVYYIIFHLRFARSTVQTKRAT